MIRNIYDVTLKLITPSVEGNKIDFSNKEEDILEAVYFFNEKFRAWNKRIVIYMISKKSIHLLLVMEKEKQSEHITARDIRFFTTYLNNQKEWFNYSRNSSKLFESVNFSLIDAEIARELLESIVPESGIHNQQFEDINFLNNIKPKVVNVASENKDVNISDEDILAIINYLLKTKNKGQRHDEKVNTLSQIKNLLEKWM